MTVKQEIINHIAKMPEQEKADALQHIVCVTCRLKRGRFKKALKENFLQHIDGGYYWKFQGVSVVVVKI
jgi:sulfur relay (sulfurtransferase) complex TusBCD TusD component (DsrE family)